MLAVRGCAFEERRIGLEQEFFLVDKGGAPSGRADGFLARCGELAVLAGRDPARFAPECATGMIEVSTPPVSSVGELAEEYLKNLRLALRAGRDLGLRLYPLATYPLAVRPALRDEARYRLQSRTVGAERFLNAGRCVGVHLHLEVPPGVVDPRVGVNLDAPPADREELVNTYNLATALDAFIVALGRSCPFCDGEATGLAPRAALYRGVPDLAPEGLYAVLREVGGLRPYAADAEELVSLQFERHHAWLAAMDRAGVGRELLQETGDGLLDTAWNPVRLNAVGTVEIRGVDGNYPAAILATASVIRAAAERVRREGLTVRPAPGVETFEVTGDGLLLVPDFGYLSGRLFRAAATGGVGSPEIVAYLDSVAEFTAAADGWDVLRPAGETDGETDGPYRTTEESILRDLRVSRLPHRISRGAGLRLAREACDRLEEQAAGLYRPRDPLETMRVLTEEG